MATKPHPQGSLISRLFGNENVEQRSPIGEDDWTQQSIANTLAAGGDAGPAPTQVEIVKLPDVRDPTLRMSVALNLAVAAPAGGQVIPCRGNCVLYADSTNGTDRFQLVYADTQGDVTQSQRSMVPGRLRRESYFNFLYVTWTVTAGATATLEIYDDPDGALYIQD